MSGSDSTIDGGLRNGASVSHWQATSEAAAWGSDLPATADVVVIGSGIVGSSAAYWLARAGVRLILLDKVAPAFGATGRNGGFMTFGTAEGYRATSERIGHAATRMIFDMTLRSRVLAHDMIAEEGIDCDFRQPGRLTLSLSGAEHAAHAAEVAALQADGYQGELLDRDATQELIATPLGDTIVGAVFAPHDAMLHSARLVYGIAAAAQRHGAQVAAAEVLRLESHGSGVAVITNRGTIAAGAVLVAANAWTSQLIPQLDEIVVPVRGQMLSYAPIAPVFQTGIGAEVTATGEYWQQTPSGAIVIGGCRAAAAGRDVRELAMVPTAEVQAALETVLPDLFPALHGLEIARRWAGLMAFTPDYLPVVDQAPQIPNVWFAGGFCGHGMPFGVVIGRHLADAARSGTLADEVAPLRLSRPSL
ncbi:MAG TPA: FAD-binding oxidoreductase [Roseiflexaceae bacterium]|nr:FAD-binding oxidoreductase [Roseiflexaceae bacterium]HMP40610.1 FAD-binding oxidoreductase [Roseiflexaceae bacterium]